MHQASLKKEEEENIRNLGQMMIDD